MTAVWPAERCPSCEQESSVTLAAGGRLCLNCRHEWEPGETTGPLASEGSTFAATSSTTLAVVPDPPAPTDLAGQVAAARAEYVGRDVIVHELEAAGTVLGVDDDGQAVIEFGSGYHVWCTPDQFSLVEQPNIADEVIAGLLAVDYSIAAQIVRAGASTLTGDGDSRRIGMPPDGFLPDDGDVIPVVEHGASYAVALIAFTYGVSNEHLARIATELDNAAEAAKEATGR